MRWIWTTIVWCLITLLVSWESSKYQTNRRNSSRYHAYIAPSAFMENDNLIGVSLSAGLQHNTNQWDTLTYTFVFKKHKPHTTI